MAEEIVGVKIQVDATDMNKSVGDLRKKIVETEAEVKRLKDTYGETSKEAIEGQKQLAKLQEITNKKIEQQNERLDNAAKTISKAAESNSIIVVLYYKLNYPTGI